MKKVSLLFGIHMHQPVDNFGDAVEEAIKLCYRPFFETMVDYPEFKFAVHSSGWLLEQIRLNHPDIFEKMQYLTKQGSIEWIGAGYYEPVLSAIPSKDRVAQIQMMSRFLKKHFGVQARGLWLTERVWESALIADLLTCKIDYVVVDDYHFLSSGFDPSAMDGYYTTEESGESLSLFPIAKSLRYALPFYNVERSIATILECAKRDEGSAAIIFDDAEKFGLWPKTHEWVYEKGWLKEFVKAVLANEGIMSEHYSQYKKANRSLGIAYLNNTSYIEMGEWSLRAHQTLALEKLHQEVGEEYFDSLGVAFIKGGIWKNFFVKYVESNYLHKRMLYFSKRQENFSKSELESLYKLQTNDVFWHGVFGGLYLPNLRDNAYRYLLEIEKAQAPKSLNLSVEDIDMDGFDELKITTANTSAVFSSKFGGQMVEFGSFDTLFNWQNTLMRRYEAYHEKIRSHDAQIEVEHKEDEIETIHSNTISDVEELKAELVYDWHPKYSFVEHFCSESPSLESFQKASFQDIADFANQPYTLHKSKPVFSREGAFYLNEKSPAKIQKAYSFTDNVVSARLTCKSQCNEKLYLAEEFNFHFAHPHLITLNDQKIEGGLKISNSKKLVIEDDFTNKRLTINTDQECEILAYVLNTISQSESGFNKMAQGVSILFITPFVSKLDINFSLELSDV
jgi:alpha-amylase/alpha-mannosidase (GH57 family)